MRASLSESRPDPDRGPRFPICRRQDALRSPGLSLQGDGGELFGPGFGPCRHDAAPALHEATGETGYLERALDWQRAGPRPPLRQSADRRLFPHRRRCRGTGGAPQFHRRRSYPNPNAGQPRTWCGSPPQAARTRLVIAGRQAVRRATDRSPTKIFHACRASQCARSAAAGGRDRGGGFGPQAHDPVAAALKVPYLDRIVMRAPNPRSLPGRHPAQDKIRSTPAVTAASVRGETCSLPVTSGEQLAQTLSAMRVETAG